MLAREQGHAGVLAVGEIIDVAAFRILASRIGRRNEGGAFPALRFHEGHLRRRLIVARRTAREEQAARRRMQRWGEAPRHRTVRRDYRWGDSETRVGPSSTLAFFPITPFASCNATGADD